MATEFFSLNYKPSKSQIRIDTKADYDFGSVQDAGTNLINENEFYVDEGKNWFDIIRFQDVANFAISERVKMLLEENDISGWQCFPIVIHGHSDKPYFGFQILSKAGKILNLDMLNDYVDQYIEFDTNTWNGSDFFTLDETGITACTPKVKALFENAMITNVQFDRL